VKKEVQITGSSPENQFNSESPGDPEGQNDGLMTSNEENLMLNMNEMDRDFEEETMLR
jgi:hypothetical protein